MPVQPASIASAYADRIGASVLRDPRERGYKSRSSGTARELAKRLGARDIAFIHGFAGTPEVWADVAVPNIEARYITLPGHGAKLSTADRQRRSARAARLKGVKDLYLRARRIRDAVIGLIAGISALDVRPMIAIAFILAYALTRYLQRIVPGT